MTASYLMAPVSIEHLLKIEYRNRRDAFLAYGCFVTANTVNKVIFHFEKIELKKSFNGNHLMQHEKVQQNRT